MKQYNVTIERQFQVTYFRDFKVEAHTPEDAEEIALQKAGMFKDREEWVEEDSFEQYIEAAGCEEVECD